MSGGTDIAAGAANADSWTRTGRTAPRVVVVGAGLSGLCLAIRLRQLGLDSFEILEKSDDVGGTWLENVYPNAGCDIPSFLYSFSFAPKHDWTRKFARQPEILAYLRDCVDRFDVRRHVAFGTAATEARFDETRSVWEVRTDRGDVRTADVLVSAVGQLNRPRIPAFPGLESFAGPAFHSARWDRAFDPAGRTVAVVGSGASAVQFLPEIASAARRTLLFQRSPNWIHPLSDHAYSAARRWAHVHVPGLARLYRAGLFLSFESRYLAFRKESLASRIYTAWLRRRMRRLVPPALHAAVIPDYPAGCKRILLSNDYLETLRRDDVELVRDPIERVAPEGLVAGGRTHPADAIVFATGFETSRFLAPLRIAGRGGVLLEEAWRDRPRTCLGMLAAGFPNLFLLYGPNTNLGHNSIVFMVECQVEALLRCLQAAIARRAAEIEVPAALVDRCDRDLQERLRRTVWDGDCASWYRGSDGAITANWSSTATAYWWRTRRLDPDLLLRPSSNGRGTD